MNILGIITSDVGGHPSACVLREGRLIALAEEERFIRVKQAPGRFPSRAARYCLERAGLRLDEIHAIAVGWDADAYRWRFPLFLAQSFLKQRLFGRHRAAAHAPVGRPPLGSGVLNGLRSLAAFHPRTLTEKIVLGLRDAGYGACAVPPISFVNHHRAHAASAFYSSGFEESAVLVFDGHGAHNATTLWRGEGRRLELLREINIPHSLGWFYSAFTEYLGFDPSEGEVKLMGLAPYGKANEGIGRFVDQVLEITADGVRVDAGCLFYGQRSYGKFFSDVIVDRLGPPRAGGEPITDRHRAVAWEVQRRLEEAGVHLAGRALELSGSRNLCLAGGVALNCKMNGEIHKQAGAERIFVQPLAHDGGTSLGAAQLVAMEHGDECRFVMDHPYWGPEYSDVEIEAVLRQSRAPFRRSERVAEEGARMIADGKIVGWFQGRLECGPRALGGRSILADPRNPSMKDLVNDRVKFREAWRPFALSILEESFGQFVSRPAPSPFMTMAFDVIPEKESLIASAIHEADKTTRPQTVSRTTNPRYWDLIDSFRRITGVPCVLNTSFNVRDEPMVCTPTDSLRCFFGTGMDALIIGDFVVEKGL